MPILFFSMHLTMSYIKSSRFKTLSLTRIVLQSDSLAHSETLLWQFHYIHVLYKPVRSLRSSDQHNLLHTPSSCFPAQNQSVVAEFISVSSWLLKVACCDLGNIWDHGVNEPVSKNTVKPEIKRQRWSLTRFGIQYHTSKKQTKSTLLVLVLLNCLGHLLVCIG